MVVASILPLLYGQLLPMQFIFPYLVLLHTSQLIAISFIQNVAPICLAPITILIQCCLYGFAIHHFPIIFIATSPPDFETLSTIFIKTFHYKALPTSHHYLIFNLYPCCDLSTQCLFFLSYYIRLLPPFYFRLSGFSKNPTLSTSITNIPRSALTWLGLIFHQVIEGRFLSSNCRRLLILLFLFP